MVDKKNKSDLNEALGLPDQDDLFTIDGEKYPVSNGITLEEQETWLTKLGGFVPKSIYSAVDPERRKVYYGVLARAFDNKVPEEKLKKMKAKDASDAIFRFLEG